MSDITVPRGWGITYLKLKCDNFEYEGYVQVYSSRHEFSFYLFKKDCYTC